MSWLSHHLPIKPIFRRLNLLRHLVGDIFDALARILGSLSTDIRNLATFHVNVVHNMNILTGDRNMLINIKVDTGYFNARLTVKLDIPRPDTRNDYPPEGATQNSFEMPAQYALAIAGTKIAQIIYYNIWQFSPPP